MKAPSTAGVYVFLGMGGELLYVGKATNLRRRLADHARAQPTSLRLAALYERAASTRWVECSSPDEAAMLEADLIVGLEPLFNASYSDRRVWPYVVVDDDGMRVTATPEARAYGCFPH